MKVRDVVFKISTADVNIKLQRCNAIVDRSLVTSDYFDIPEVLDLEVARISPVNERWIDVYVYPCTIEEYAKELFGAWAANISEDMGTNAIGESFRELERKIRTVKEIVDRMNAKQEEEDEA